MWRRRSDTHHTSAAAEEDDDEGDDADDKPRDGSGTRLWAVGRRVVALRSEGGRRDRVADSHEGGLGVGHWGAGDG